MSWLQTYSGLIFDFSKLDIDHLNIIDIAHSLSNQCRYNGHCSRFYSVAEHSVYVSRFSNMHGYGLEGLLHDASEAYTSDIPKPLKDILPQYVEMEEKVQDLIADKFGLRFPFPEVVHEYDARILINEK